MKNTFNKPRNMQIYLETVKDQRKTKFQQNYVSFLEEEKLIILPFRPLFTFLHPKRHLDKQSYYSKTF